MGGPDRVLPGLARPPRREEGFESGRELRLDEEIREGGVGAVGGARREDELGEGRDLDLARACPVRDRDCDSASSSDETTTCRTVASGPSRRWISTRSSEKAAS
jgi:hypothetical protein